MKSGFLFCMAIGLATATLIFGCGRKVKPVVEVAVRKGELPESAPVQIGVDDWPWWRGPNRQNHAIEPSNTEIPSSFSDSQNVIWKADVPGRGHSSPIVVGSQVILCTADEDKQRQLVVSYNRENGEQNWLTEVSSGGFPGSSGVHPDSSHANGTAASDGHRVYVAFLSNEQITAYALTLDGEIAWETELGYFSPKFGYAPSPCIYKSLVIFAGDNLGGAFLTAINRDTGQVVWRKSRPNADSYSSPIVLEVAGKPQLLISGNQQLASYDPETGEPNWTCAGTAETTCGTAVSWNQELVFASGGYPQQETIAVDAATGKKVWSDRARCYEQSMIVANDCLFALTNGGIAYCWDAATGEVRWRQRVSGKVVSSPILVGDRIFTASENGIIRVLEANPDKFVELAENQLGSSINSSPAVSGNRMFWRVARQFSPYQETLYCIGQ